jgi:hypothetical protein
MARTNARLDAARSAYREALEAARANPTPEAWTRLLAAGKELSAAQEPRKTSRRSRRGAAAREPAGALSEGSLDLDPSAFD